MADPTVTMANFTQFWIRRSIVFTGQGSSQLAPEIFEGLGAKRVMLITDPFITKAGLTAQVVKAFEHAPDGGAKLVYLCDDIIQDAKCEYAVACLQKAKECRADGLLALGGGSVLDIVKTVKWMMFHHIDSLRELLEAFSAGPLRMEKWPTAKAMNIAHVAIATTAGTGAEISTTAALHDTVNKRNLSLMNPFLGADYALSDADMTVSLPAKLTAETGCDALAHAIEAFFARVTFPMSEAYAIEGIRVITQNLPLAVKNGSNIAARSNMLLGDLLGIGAFGLALNRIPIHNIALAFDNKYHIPHGAGIAMLIAPVMEVLRDVYTPRIIEFAEILGIRDVKDADEAYRRVIDWLYAFKKSIGVAEKFDLQMTEADVEDLVRETHADGSSASYQIDDEAIREIARKVVTIV